MKEKVVTIFRTKQCQHGKKLREALQHEDVNQEAVQVVYISESSEISTFFRVYSSPTVLLFEDGEEVVRYEGGEATLDKVLEFLNGK
jgi:thioredoxin-like negative regulator of GroEL